MAAPIGALILVGIVSTLAALFRSYAYQPTTFHLTLAALARFVATLIVTVLIEVPIIKQIVTWTPATLPNNWQQLRDRWGAFHLARITSSLLGLVLLLVGAIL